MFVHAPADRPSKAPLVVVLHGCTQSAEDYASPAGWLDLADRFGFVVLAPEQTRANNPNLCFNWYLPGEGQAGPREARSIAAMIAQAVETFDLDAGRVFVTGLSAGGAMTATLLATYPDLFAGGAVMAGLAHGSARSMAAAFSAKAGQTDADARELGSRVRGSSGRTGPWPTVSVWHGQSDTIVRPAAGEALARQWCDVHGIVDAPKTARIPAGRDFLVWMDPQGRPAVELHRIVGMGHGTPVKANGPDSCGGASTYTPETGASSSLRSRSAGGSPRRTVVLRPTRRLPTVRPVG